MTKQRIIITEDTKDFKAKSIKVINMMAGDPDRDDLNYSAFIGDEYISGGNYIQDNTSGEKRDYYIGTEVEVEGMEGEENIEDKGYNTEKEVRENFMSGDKCIVQIDGDYIDGVIQIPRNTKAIYVNTDDTRLDNSIGNDNTNDFLNYGLKFAYSLRKYDDFDDNDILIHKIKPDTAKKITEEERQTLKTPLVFGNIEWNEIDDTLKLPVIDHSKPMFTI